MEDGFLKVACASTKIKVADCKYNSGEIIKTVQQAYNLGACIVNFPELCVTGYTCCDLFFKDKLIKDAESYLVEICNNTKDLEILSVVGVPIRENGKLFNCAAVLYKGQILGIVPKTNIPNYNEFYEKRHFSEGFEEGTVTIGDKEVFMGSKVIFKCRQMQSLSFGVEICEDLWSVIPPSSYLASGGANMILNLSASNDYMGKAEYRRDLIKVHSSKLVCAYLYSSAGVGESSTDLVFSGHNIIAECGQIIKESDRFSESIVCTEVDLNKVELSRCRLKNLNENVKLKEIYFDYTPRSVNLTRKFDKMPFLSEKDPKFKQKCSEILKLQTLALKTRLSNIGCSKVVIGLSGGLDSTLAMLVCLKTFDELKISRENIIGVTMPCFGTSERTFKNVKNLALAYSITLKQIPIDGLVNSLFDAINHPRDLEDVVYENVQARERTHILMSIANQENGIVIGTGDLSELALGWTTYNGDHMSMYAVNASIPKTLVKYIIRYEAMNQFMGCKNILDDIINTPISPELLPADESGSIQSSEAMVGPYSLVDFFIYYYLHCDFSPKKIFRLASNAFKGVYEDADIKKWLFTFFKRFFANQFKRSCLPDSPKVILESLSPRSDFRMPSDAQVQSILNEIENIKIEV